MNVQLRSTAELPGRTLDTVEHETLISFLIGVGIACAGLLSVLVSRKKSR